MDGAAAQLLGLVGQGQRQPPVDQATEQQVEVGAVIFDIGFQRRDHPLIVVVRRIVNVLHVGIVQFEDAETGIECIRHILIVDAFIRCTPTRRNNGY